ncbi:MAG: hypothetical protein ROO76_09240 [Terriglobia bacterium]|nr:hypothetical protein [Terriglobia bacterium]
MAALRLCTHIKTNGIKCGSPALRHHTLCYFHYQWQKRDQRRVRLGGPVGMNKNTGIELPLLDGPEAILVSIMEIQRGLLDHRIEVKMGTALLYSLQLALQARIPYSGLCAREPVRECPELDMELEMERARAMRPAKEKCATCPKKETCLSPRNCRKLPKLPAGYRREGDRLVRDADTDAADASTQPCHPERSAAVSRVVEGPFVSSSEATAPETTPIPETASNSLRESSPGREPGENEPNFPSSRANARRQIASADEKQNVLRLRDSRRSAHDTSKTDANSYADCILGFNPNPLIDLPPKFPQLIETTQAGN